ncbi:MAG: cysteine--tRNA ligase [Burkholderiales bacterium]
MLIYNSLARDKQIFNPMTPGQVRMYVCGMTVYDYCHLGHARVMVVFDMAYRWLKASGFEVNYVRNITDIDDKIIKRAAENKEPIDALTNRFIQFMHEDEARLGILPPTHEPRATQFVPGMVRMIQTLVEKGLAYPAPNGDVYYAVHRFEGYGKLSGKSLDDLRAGERVDVDPNKRDPLDFVLWKAAKSGEPAWDSPWGRGRPGWHIECSVMSEHYLGEHFDIHGGGQDLQFPHHENEIAQSEGAHGHGFVNYWMHNGFVRVDNEKMSKSLGNFFTIREVLKQFDAETVRFFILRAHYRSPLNYSDQHLQDAKQSLRGLYITLQSVPPEAVEIDWNNSYAVKFKQAMDDDFDSHGAITVLFELAREANKTKSGKRSGLLKTLGGILGILQHDPVPYLQGLAGGIVITPATGSLKITGYAPTITIGFSPERIDQLIAERLAARKTRDFARADAIRKELTEAGIILEDGPQGTTWRRA